MTTELKKTRWAKLKCPKNAYYAAQTQRAVENFPISGIPMSRYMIKALGIVKASCAKVNADLGLLDQTVASYIMKAAQEVIDGKLDEHFPLDIFQTGSGTSTNMNTNEVIAFRGSEMASTDGVELRIHPNDHVNFGQSSNDVFPTAIRIAAAVEAKQSLVPSLEHLHTALREKR